MSYSSSQLQQQFREVRIYALDYPNTDVVLESNKRVVVRLNDAIAARNLAYNLRHAGYQCAIRSGLKTSSFYVQAHLNSPV